MHLSHSLIRNSPLKVEGDGLTDYSTRQAVIFVLAEDSGQLLGLMEIVKFGIRFGGWSRHVAVIEDECCNRSVLVSSRLSVPFESKYFKYWLLQTKHHLSTRGTRELRG